MVSDVIELSGNHVGDDLVERHSWALIHQKEPAPLSPLPSLKNGVDTREGSVAQDTRRPDRQPFGNELEGANFSFRVPVKFHEDSGRESRGGLVR